MVNGFSSDCHVRLYRFLRVHVLLISAMMCGIIFLRVFSALQKITSKMYQLLISFVLLATYIGGINGENILAVMPLPARSHFKSFQPLLEELVTRGHNLTLISGHKLAGNLQGKYRHIDVKHLFSELSNAIFKSVKPVVTNLC